MEIVEITIVFSRGGNDLYIIYNFLHFPLYLAHVIAGISCAKLTHNNLPADND
nr:MAG TPA: hypothetical protein [Bacteriophage sp.]